jgi:hypothetical protein
MLVKGNPDRQNCGWLKIRSISLLGYGYPCSGGRDGTTFIIWPSDANNMTTHRCVHMLEGTLIGNLGYPKYEKQSLTPEVEKALRHEGVEAFLVFMT